MGDFGKMNIACQIKFLDTSTASFRIVDQYDYTGDVGKFPIPRKDEHVNLLDKNKRACIDYVVQDIKYTYKHDVGLFSNNVIVDISIYVRRVY